MYFFNILRIFEWNCKYYVIPLYTISTTCTLSFCEMAW